MAEAVQKWTPLAEELPLIVDRLYQLKRVHQQASTARMHARTALGLVLMTAHATVLCIMVGCNVRQQRLYHHGGAEGDQRGSWNAGFVAEAGESVPLQTKPLQIEHWVYHSELR